MISAVVPWQGGCGWRERALGFVIEQLERVADEVVIGETSGVWCKARAVAEGLQRASGDVLAVVDADVFIRDDEWLSDCVQRLDEAPWVSPHGTVWRLSRAGTTDVLEGRGSRDTEAKHSATAGGGLVVLRRELYDQVPLDPTFERWGQEDESWALALRTLAGEPWIGSRHLWHLWHPPQPRQDRAIGSPEGLARRRRYEAAFGKPDEMRRLLEEVRHAAT